MNSIQLERETWDGWGGNGRSQFLLERPEQDKHPNPVSTDDDNTQDLERVGVFERKIWAIYEPVKMYHEQRLDINVNMFKEPDIIIFKKAWAITLIMW